MLCHHCTIILLNAKGTNQGEFLSVEKDKICIFSTETLQWEEKKAYDKASILKRNKERNRENGRTKKMEEFYRKLKVGTKLKYAFTTVIVTLAIAVVVSACFHCKDECGYL